MAKTMPLHVGIIMDGNGRWAKKRGLPRQSGHCAGMERMVKLVRHLQDRGVKYVTLYALSAENMNRPKAEVDGLFDLLRRYLDERVPELSQSGAGLRFIGDLSVLPEDIQDGISEARELCKGADFVLTLAINYGSRQEIDRAANAFLEHEGKIPFRECLEMTAPDPDLIIRTGGERRLSNFLLYQCAYSELYFTKTLFPDFTDRKLDKALKDYSKRDRRYGQVRA